MRAKKHQRKEAGQRDPFSLRTRDREIITAVNDCQVLVDSQVQRWFFKSKSPAQTRLRKLYDNEYLERHFITVAASAPASSPILYSVTEKGAYVLAQYFDYTPDQLRFPSQKLLNNWIDLQHLIEVNQFRVAISRGLLDYEWQLNQWLDETHFRANPDTVTVTNRNNRKVKKPVLPDSFFHVTVPPGQARFFIEVDSGIEGTAKFKPQIEVYEAYTKGGQYQKRFKSTSLRILIITSTQRRMKTLQQIVRTTGGVMIYWFTTKAQVSSETVLTAPIWQKLDGDELVPLIALAANHDGDPKH